tara:strand:- start:18731 stop:19183 length:453 start_codon:yes stop_codon:yes gene_type:complete
MDIIGIEGIKVSNEKIIYNSKGNILHGLKKTDDNFFGFGEAYFSMIDKNQIKGWNKHSKMTLNLLVPVGEVTFIVHDNRKNSKSKGQFFKIKLSQDNYKRLTVSPELWLAFKGGSGSSQNLILNIANILHQPKEVIKKKISSIDFNWGMI